jgi:hypothetical protein
VSKHKNNRRNLEEKPIKKIIKQRPREKNVKTYDVAYHEERYTPPEPDTTTRYRKYRQVPDGSDDLQGQ